MATSATQEASAHFSRFCHLAWGTLFDTKEKILKEDGLLAISAIRRQVGFVL
jgi:hypothetical protein